MGASRKCDNCEITTSICEKLGKYEDLDEQGRLIKLPCKVGDKIFLDFAGFGKDIDKFTVKDFHLDCFEDGETILFCDYESNDKTLSGQIDVTEFGKTVFLTKAEAEAKLKELRGEKMKVVIDIHKDFTGDYIADKFKDFFSRVIADIDCKGMCGRYEKEIAEMFLKVFDDSEEKISCNCQHNSNSRDNEPCCRCDSRQTNADRIRNMSDEELAEIITGGLNFDCSDYCDSFSNGCAFRCNRKERELALVLNWLQSEAE